MSPRKLEDAPTLRLPTSERGRKAYQMLRGHVGSTRAALIVDTLERNPENLLLQLAVLTSNTTMDLVKGRVWLIELGYLEPARCDSCGEEIDPHSDYKCELGDDRVRVTCVRCQRKLRPV